MDLVKRLLLGQVKFGCDLHAIYSPSLLTCAVSPEEIPDEKDRCVAFSVDIHVCCQAKAIASQIVHIERASGLGPYIATCVHRSNISSCS